MFNFIEFTHKGVVYFGRIFKKKITKILSIALAALAITPLALNIVRGAETSENNDKKTTMSTTNILHNQKSRDLLATIGLSIASIYVYKTLESSFKFVKDYVKGSILQNKKDENDVQLILSFLKDEFKENSKEMHYVLNIKKTNVIEEALSRFYQIVCSISETTLSRKTIEKIKNNFDKFQKTHGLSLRENKKTSSLIKKINDTFNKLNQS